MMGGVSTWNIGYSQTKKKSNWGKKRKSESKSVKLRQRKSNQDEKNKPRQKITSMHKNPNFPYDIAICFHVVHQETQTFSAT